MSGRFNLFSNIGNTLDGGLYRRDKFVCLAGNTADHVTPFETQALFQVAT